MSKLLTFKQKQNQENLNKLNTNTKKIKTEKPVNFVVYSYANQCKPIAPLGPTLGQFNVNLIEFCNKYNSETKDYVNGLYLGVSITKKLKVKEFVFKLKKPSLKSLLEILLSNFYETDELEKIENLSSNITIEMIFDLITLYSYFYNLPLNKSSNYVFSYLKSCIFIKEIIIN